MTAPNPLTAMRNRTNRLVAEGSTPAYTAISGIGRTTPVPLVAARTRGTEPAEGTFTHPATGAVYRVGELLGETEWLCEDDPSREALLSHYALEGRPKHQMTVCGACGRRTYERR